MTANEANSHWNMLFGNHCQRGTHKFCHKCTKQTSVPSTVSSEVSVFPKKQPSISSWSTTIHHTLGQPLAVHIVRAGSPVGLHIDQLLCSLLAEVVAEAGLVAPPSNPVPFGSSCGGLHGRQLGRHSMTPTPLSTSITAWKRWVWVEP